MVESEGGTEGDQKKVKATVWGRSGGTRSTPPSSLATIKRSICLYRNIREGFTLGSSLVWVPLKYI